MDTKQTEKDLSDLIKKYKLEPKLTVAKVKRFVQKESGKTASEAVHKFQKKCLACFPENINSEEMQVIVRVLTDAWNYFPHDSLGGKSPAEVYDSEVSNLEPRPDPGKREMPKVVVGGREMEWDEYEAMLKEMKRLQVPFKKWINEDVLPGYRKYLDSTLTKKTADKHFEVADIFFERVLHVGFLEFELIRKDFIIKEFPHWWQTHVMMNNLKEKEVLSSLNKLFEFLEFAHKTDIKKFGF
ncbi:MAG: hypothetical protein V1867_02545 [Candidatus Falkowbacteria bacterium]